MSRHSQLFRRALTIVGVVAALAVGYGSIRAATAWTEASAPLTITPITVSALQAKLADEGARAAALQSRLVALDARSRELAAALESAQTRIEKDADHAGDLAKELKAAKKKLARLERSIAAARAAGARSNTDPRGTTTRASSSEDDDDDEHEHEDHDDEHEEEDD
jgi:chromosome segregation ATPase